ncbi:MAG: hypothetical protein H7A46_00875 [Verrucomicrobiales bacterium]|nr:hypothetical protein [Verrucomicrobiales bacterium]
MADAEVLNIAAGSTLRISFTFSHQPGGSLTGEGLLRPKHLVIGSDLTLGPTRIDPSLYIRGTGALINPGGHELTLDDISVDTSFENQGDLTILNRVTLNGTVTNGPEATIRILATETNETGDLRLGNDFENAGLIEILSEREDSENLYLRVNNGNGTLTNLDTGTIRVAPGLVDWVTLMATITNEGIFDVGSEPLQTKPFTNNGLLAIGAGATLTTSQRIKNLDGGVLAGNRTLEASRFTNHGSIAPGASAGLLSLAGDYPEDASASLDIEILGPAPDGHDVGCGARWSLRGPVRPGAGRWRMD